MDEIKNLSVEDLKKMSTDINGVTKFFTCVAKEIPSCTPIGSFTKPIIVELYEEQSNTWINVPFRKYFTSWAYFYILRTVICRPIESIIKLFKKKRLFCSVTLECLDVEFKDKFLNKCIYSPVSNRHIKRAIKDLNEWSDKIYTRDYIAFVDNKYNDFHKNKKNNKK